MIERLNLLRFPLIFGVVLIHTSHPFMKGIWMVDFISYGLAQVCVPLFFLISGYLFFYKIKKWNENEYWDKLGSRIKTLLIPYLAWNLIALIYMALFFGIQGANTSQFWFLQELMLLVVVSPVIHLMHKNGRVWLIVILSLWLGFNWGTAWPVMSSLMPLLFFYAGSLVAVRKKSLFMFDRFGMVAAVISVTIFALTPLQKGNMVLFKVGITTGVVGILYLSQFLNRKIFLWLGGASFFVYCFHQPLLGQMIGRIFYWFQPGTETQAVALYFGTAMVTCAVGVGLYWIMKQTVPEITRFLTGGRG